MYEHYHRYLWAAHLTAGKRVLDLASGEGFGAALLSERALTVTGVDIDETSVEHARLNYAADNLEYRTADARDLHEFATGSFDVVVSFELIEHVVEQEAVLGEIARVLVPGGLLIMSTPERAAYNGGRDGENPFHAKELTQVEFAGLLESQFAHHRMWAQHAASGSTMRTIEPDPPAVRDGLTPADGADFLIERDGEDWRPSTALPLLYMVAVASNAELPDAPASSTLMDPELTIVKTRLHDLADELNGIIERRDGEIASQNAEIATRGEAIRELERRLSRLTAQIRGWEYRYERTANKGFAYRKVLALRLTQQEAAHMGARASVEQELREVRAQLDWRELQLRQVTESIIWRATMRGRGKLVALLGGEDAITVRMVQATLRLLWRLGSRRPATPEPVDHADHVPEESEAALGEETQLGPQFEPVELEWADDPVISIVMPLYAGAELTHRALQTIRDNTLYIPYEVIIVDDGDDPDTKALLANVTGARVLTNEENLGYLRSVNRGARTARGRWLVLANNDIEVLPNWAAELLDCGDSADDIAIVTPMYLQPDGLVSEAGGIIWDDASGHNYGRGDFPRNWRYGWRRAVDYGSAAALLVRTDVWQEIGGFDERFAPMYYEDADLCFAARARGYRVMYEPAAQVLHKEGSTAGLDETQGHKRHQAANRPRFREKWEETLSRDHLPPPEDPVESWAGATARRGGRVIFIDHRVPFWDKEAGALRTLEVLKSLMARGNHVTFLPDNGAGIEPYTTELQRQGIEVMHGPDLLTQLSILIAPHIEAAIVSRPSVAARYMSLLRRHAPQAELIYDTVDLHWVREAREAALLVGHHEAELLTREALWTKSLELALMRASDVTLVATTTEEARVKADVPGVVVRALPTINPVRGDAPGISERSGIIFVGGFQHTPNVDAVLRLIERVMPLVWAELPDVTVRIVGADVPDRIAALASDRVEILGWVQDLDPLLDAARLTLVPLSYGAGMKGKITQALAFGLPVVTTPIGIEGLDARDGEDVLIGPDDAALAAHAVALLQDDALWQRLSDGGKVLVNRQCSPEVVLALLDELLGDGAVLP